MEPQLTQEADRALASGDLHRAVALLSKAAETGAPDLALWLKLAALQRGTGNPGAALQSVHRALEIAPLDFTALLLRANLLQRLGDPQSGEAWGHALAQKPSSDLPAQLAAVVADAEKYHSAWVDARDQRMKSAMAGAEQRASAEELKRIDRFRTNALRRTRPYHSEPTNFHFPELVEREFHPRGLFPWIEELEAATAVLTEEMHAVMGAERAELVPYIQYADHLPLDQWRTLNRNPDWTAIHLYKNGERIEANARHCPRTMALLERLPQPKIPGAGPNAMFSLLAPDTAIPPHVGVSNARLVCHLPLVVPEGCWFRVGAETRYWREGEAFVFDDTIEHEARNPTPELRVLFIFDIWHPDLTEVEREAVRALIGADGSPAVL
jgi:aspartyl/asparaginyl beta-hydroxylase (cupin superfamily)